MNWGTTAFYLKIFSPIASIVALVFTFRGESAKQTPPAGPKKRRKKDQKANESADKNLNAPWIQKRRASLFAGLAMLVSIFAIYTEHESSAESKRIASMSGILGIEGKDPIESLRTIQIGNSGSELMPSDLEALNKFALAGIQESLLKIRYEKGRVLVSCVIRNGEGKIMAEIIDNEWTLVPSETYDRNYTQDALEIRDSRGDVVLKMRLYAGILKFEMMVHGRSGRTLLICETEAGGAMVTVFGPQDKPCDYKIKPMFRYPSASHLGEFNEDQSARY